jgi:predicted DNA-binding transcriptional regulator AlpA
MLKAATVGQLLGLSARAVYDIPEHDLPRYRLGAGRGAVRFDPADVEAYRAACRSTGTSPPVNGASTSTAASTAGAFGVPRFAG